MNIGNIFKAIHGSLDVTKLERLVDNETDEEYIKVAEYICKELDLSIDNFYFNMGGFYPFCYYNGYVIVDIILDMKFFQSKEFNQLEYLKHQIVNVTNLLKKLEEDKKFLEYFTILDKRLRIIKFNELFNQIPKDDIYEVFKDMYVSSEYGFTNLSEDSLLKIYKHKNDYSFKEHIKTDRNGYVKIYRGAGDLSTTIEQAYSWTLDKNVALMFANRFNSVDKKLYTAKVHIDKILDLIDDRAEQEIIVLYKDLENIKTKNI